MCGIAGAYSYHPSAGQVDRSEIRRMSDQMIERGPDSDGEWWSTNGRVGLAHRRLAIQDLSDAGHQPMRSDCGRYTVIFNGEIYNYPILRSELEHQGVRFKSRSDTEILLHLYKAHGPSFVEKLRGMFAFAIWDELSSLLFAARDPFGMKPFYYSDDGWTFKFASQVKALIAGNTISRELDPAGVCGFYLWGNVPEPHTIYRDIKALPAGTTMIIDELGPREPVAYFSIASELNTGREGRLTPDQVRELVASAARETVAVHLLSDVDVGLFLSAGIDSGALLGLMDDAGAQNIRAVTLGFSEYENGTEDESKIASQVANFYDAQHVIKKVNESEFEADLENILTHMDQPSIDGINTWFIAKAAKEAGLKVAISGLGSDEVLAGYPSFSDIPKWVKAMALPSRIPGFGIALSRALRTKIFNQHSPKLAGIPIYAGTYAGAYFVRRGLFMPWELEKIVADKAIIQQGLQSLATINSVDANLQPDPQTPFGRVSALECSIYMRNQLLRDADWAGMAHGVEIRVPFVDVEFFRQIARVLPHIEGKSGKKALAMAPAKPLPESVRDRKKTGFTVPIGDWLNSASKSRDGIQTKGGAARAWAQRVIQSQFGEI